MEEEFSADPAKLLEAANDFAYHPGTHSEASTEDFLNRFPLPAIINVLQTKADYPGLENALVDCLERVFRTKYGASLIPHYMQFVMVGLGADSQKVRRLACNAVSSLVGSSDPRSAAQLVLQHGVYQLLLNCLIDGDEQVATASMDAIEKLASSSEGISIIFPEGANEAAHLGNLAEKCSSLGRVRILALIVRLFSISSSVASIVCNAKLIDLLEAEVGNTNDTLLILSVLELFYELAEVPHSTKYLSGTKLPQLLGSIISTSSESILRSRAMMITGRLLSKDNAFALIGENSFRTIVSAIDKRFGFLESHDSDECECALEALGQIGSSNQGAALLLSSSSLAARHVIDAAFDRQQHGKQLAALHALANIVGEARAVNDVILNCDAEENLRQLIYEKASKTAKSTPSGQIQSILKQDSEIRLAGYRVITGLVARPLFLTEILSRNEIIDVVTDTYSETNKLGMETRHRCCEAIYKALMSSGKAISDPALAGIATKLEEAIRRGPFLAKKHTEARPVVITADRF